MATRQIQEKYTLYISDGSSRDGGGTLDVSARDLDDAKRRWADWARGGEYPPGDHTVEGSIWCAGTHVADVCCGVIVAGAAD